MEESIANSVGVERIKQGLSQDELAKRADVSRQTINALEKGNYFPSLLLALKISESLDISIEKLFSLERGLSSNSKS